MFPGSPEYCNVLGTLSKYFQNFACQLGNRSPFLKADGNSTKVPISNTIFTNKVPISESYYKIVTLPVSLKLLQGCHH